MSTKPAETHETLTRKAEHARWLADCVAGDEAADRLRMYADELDAQATAIGGRGKTC
jgi:nucleotide-binding universal stress UspA family protein